MSTRKKKSRNRNNPAASAPTPFSQEQQDLFTVREDVRKLKIRQLEDAARAIQQFIDEVRYTRF